MLVACLQHISIPDNSAAPETTALTEFKPDSAKCKPLFPAENSACVRNYNPKLKGSRVKGFEGSNF